MKNKINRIKEHIEKENSNIFVAAKSILSMEEYKEFLQNLEILKTLHE